MQKKIYTARRHRATNKHETFACGACGRRIARKSRQQRYCSDRCRDYARRENKARTAIKNSVGYQGSGQPTNPLFLSNKNNELQRQKTGSRMPLNVLGGHRWPSSITVERDLLRKVIKAEIGES
jgi:hypothetical protein